jgi:hypothetical protein
MHETLLFILDLMQSIRRRAFTPLSCLQYVTFFSPVALFVNNLYFLKVERGFTAHRNGVYVDPPQFNHDKCWSPLKDFHANIDRVKAERWKSLLQFRVQGTIEDSDGHGDRSMISAFRADMYIGSSPVKPQTRELL